MPFSPPPLSSVKTVVKIFQTGFFCFHCVNSLFDHPYNLSTKFPFCNQRCFGETEYYVCKQRETVRAIQRETHSALRASPHLSYHTWWPQLWKWNKPVCFVETLAHLCLSETAMKYGPAPKIMFCIANTQKKKGCGRDHDPNFLPSCLYDLGSSLSCRVSAWAHRSLHASLFGRRHHLLRWLIVFG